MFDETRLISQCFCVLVVPPILYSICGLAGKAFAFCLFQSYDLILCLAYVTLCRDSCRACPEDIIKYEQSRPWCGNVPNSFLPYAAICKLV